MGNFSSIFRLFLSLSSSTSYIRISIPHITFIKLIEVFALFNQIQVNHSLIAVTDSEACVRYCEEQPGIRNLIDIYSACTGKTPDEVEKEFDGKGYGDFKLAVGESVVDVLKPVQERFADLSKDKAYIDSIIKNNAEKANYYALKTLRKVQKKVGFPERIR